LLVDPGFFSLERWPLAHSDSGLGHQCEGRRCVLSMEYRIMCPRKDWRALVLGFSPLSTFESGEKPPSNDEF
jgi:hypothetical protein